MPGHAGRDRNREFLQGATAAVLLAGIGVVVADRAEQVSPSQAVAVERDGQVGGQAILRGRRVHDALGQVKDVSNVHPLRTALQVGVPERAVKRGAAERVVPLELEHLGGVALRHARGVTAGSRRANLPLLRARKLDHQDIVRVGVRLERGRIVG